MEGVVSNKELFSIILFFVIWVAILVPVGLAINKFSNKNEPKTSTVKVPNSIKPCSNNLKTIFMKSYHPKDVDRNSQKAAQIKLQLCENLYAATGKITSIKYKDNEEQIESVIVDVNNTPLKLTYDFPHNIAVNDRLIIYYEKGISGITKYITAVKLPKINKEPNLARKRSM